MSIATLAEQYGVPSVAYGLLQDGMLHAHAYNVGEPRCTAFRIGSLTKTFTATAVMQLRDDGVLGLDDPVARHLPAFAAVSPGEVTIRMLLTHRSGLGGDGPFSTWHDMRYPTRSELIASFDRAKLCIPPLSAFKYSNYGYAILGAVIGDWWTHVRTRVLEPLTMTRTTTNDPGEPFAIGYDVGTQVRAIEHDSASFNPAGGLWSTLDDLAAWTSFQLDGNSDVLADATRREMHRPQFLDPGWNSGIGLGWLLTREGTIWHGGAVPGFHTQLVIDPAKRAAAFALSNAMGHPVVDAACRELLDTVPAPDPQPRTPVPSDYHGHYEGRMRAGAIVTADGIAMMALPGLPAPPADPVEPAGDHTFVFTAGRYAGEPVVFDLDAGTLELVYGGFVMRKNQ